ncbi:thiol-disulfide oxidoreductase DCC family protein [Metabacillus sp. RGM 3146]|uniref:thiol-disulfide oxidoreductase DCC family protein n=1 Tax=Metabacillus sp. RGM 3146 TaxID=3401092 RepID=UPI003B9C9318
MAKNLVFFDAQCPLCYHTKKILQVLDWKKRISWMAVQEIEESPYAFLRSNDLYDQIYMVSSSNLIFSGFHTIRKILFEIPLTRLLSMPLFLPFIDKILQPLYLFISKNRYRWFGRYEVPQFD